MMRSLFSGVSGLKGHQTRMDVIGNNIANVNATGFKSSRVTFADTLSQTTSGASAPGETIGGTNPKQIGLGTGVASIDLLFTDGSIQSTGKNTDLCLSGNGLFIVKSGNETYYTRDGAFEFDAEGNYVLPGSGLFVQGWSASNGELNTTGAVGNITVKAGKSMAAAATTSATYENNLNSALPTITQISGGTIAKDSVTGTKPLTLTIGGKEYTVEGIDKDLDMSKSWKVKEAVGGTDTSITLTDGGTPTPTEVVCTLSGPAGTAIDADTAVSSIAGGQITASSTNAVTLILSDDTKVQQTSGAFETGNSMPVTTTINVYDSLGNAHAVTVYFVETDPSTNQWKVTVGKDFTDTSSTQTQIITDADGTETTVEMEDVTLTFDENGKFKKGSGSSELTLKNGSMSPMSVSIDFSALTQYAGSNTVKGNADGNAAGTLKSISIDSSGIITGTYTNGLKQSEAQVAIAQFTNASGLTKTGSSLYQESNNSGTANVKTAIDLGVTITPSALEMSNVDVANEFSDMIITQRGFQSNSKIITVGDEMLETVINMKR
ncbi:flagellar hook protein FlgE [Selenomonas sp. FC4001]|uniref:flagellar hook protein FlgE n=1 Tax=Selenomonas sp. FC4001 TaxID=1408313 RepID=UPI00056C52BB|nr:flagellar hook-basal body complex protein [Selenomonas sp. FC4001]